MKFKGQNYIIFFLFMLSVVIFGCSLFKTGPKGPELPKKIVITGVVVLGNNQAVPDSLNCTVKYFDINLNKDVTKTVKNGVFILENLANGKYKLEAITEIGNMKGSRNFSIKNKTLVGSTTEKNILRVILGRENVQEAPVPPDFFEGDVIPGAGKIIDGL